MDFWYPMGTARTPIARLLYDHDDLLILIAAWMVIVVILTGQGMVPRADCGLVRPDVQEVS